MSRLGISKSAASLAAFWAVSKELGPARLEIEAADSSNQAGIKLKALGVTIFRYIGIDSMKSGNLIQSLSLKFFIREN